MNVFRKADEDGRRIFKAYCDTQSWCKFHRESKDDYAHWDVSYFSGSTKIIGEIKKRNYNANDYCNWDYEQLKHDNLLEVYRKIDNEDDVNIDIQYINIYDDDVIRIWTTTNTHIEQQPTIANRNKTNLGNKQKVPKLIYNCKIGTEAHKGKIN